MALKIWKRKDGRYEARVMIKGERISVYGKNPSDVRAKITRKQWEAEHYKEIARSDRLRDSMEKWLKTVKRSGDLKASSYDRVESTFREHIQTSEMARKRLDAVEPADIQALLNLKSRKGYSYSSIKKIYDLFREFFRYHVDCDIIMKDPMRMVKMPRVQNRQRNIEFFTADEVRRIIEVAESLDKKGKRNYRYGEAIILLLLSGMRNGELRALTIKSVDLDNKLLHVNKTVSRAIDERSGKYTYMIQTPKTINAVRDIPLTGRAEQAVRVLLKTTSNRRTGYLITTKKGNIVSHAMLQRSFDRILKKAGLEHKGLHATRHTFGTIMVKNAEGNGQIKEASELLGHSRISTTYDYYVGTTMDEKIELLNSLEELV